MEGLPTDSYADIIASPEIFISSIFSVNFVCLEIRLSTKLLYSQCVHCMVCVPIKGSCKVIYISCRSIVLSGGDESEAFV